MTAARRLRDLQWQLYCSNERRIREMVLAPRRFARSDLDTYEQEMTESIPADFELSTPPALRAAIARAQVILVGDYHTLRQSQRGFLRVLRAVRSRKVVIGLEFVAARYQRAVDAYVAGRIDDETFLRRTEYRRAWPSYQVWPSFKPIFEHARARGLDVIALDCASSECGTVFSRAGFAAWRIVEALRDHPHHKIVVLMGEAHLAPGHLPAEVRRALDRVGVRGNVLTIHQNLDAVYFALLDQGVEDRVDVVKLSEDRYVVPVSTPVAAQHSFLTTVSGDEAPQASDDRAAVRKDFARYVRTLGRLLGVRTTGMLEGVTVCGPGDLKALVTLGYRLGDETWRYLARQVAENESLCLPEHGIVYLASLTPTHQAEEAAHFLKARLASGPMPQDPVDYLYSRAVHEAVGYFGAKLFNPKRKPPTMAILREVVAQSMAAGQGEFAPELVFAAQMAAWHRKRQWRRTFTAHSFDYYLRACGLPGGLEDLGPEVMRPIVHFLGYELGERLYIAFRTEHLAAREVRRIFETNLEVPGEAFRVYHGLATTLRSIRLPQRF